MGIWGISLLRACRFPKGTELTGRFLSAPQVRSSALCKKEHGGLPLWKYQKGKKSPTHLMFPVIPSQRQRFELDGLWRTLLDPGFYIQDGKPDGLLIRLITETYCALMGSDQELSQQGDFVCFLLQLAHFGSLPPFPNTRTRTHAHTMSFKIKLISLLYSQFR